MTMLGPRQGGIKNSTIYGFHGFMKDYNAKLIIEKLKMIALTFERRRLTRATKTNNKTMKVHKI